MAEEEKTQPVKQEKKKKRQRICKGCGKSRYIVNEELRLCQACYVKYLEERVGLIEEEGEEEDDVEYYVEERKKKVLLFDDDDEEDEDDVDVYVCSECGHTEYREFPRCKKCGCMLEWD